MVSNIKFRIKTYNFYILLFLFFSNRNSQINACYLFGNIKNDMKERIALESFICALLLIYNTAVV